MKTEPPIAESLDKRELLKVLTAFKRGNFSVRMSVENTGLSGKIADTLNDVLELNEKMARELARVSNSVGKEGKINHRASLGGSSGEWSACVDSVKGGPRLGGGAIDADQAAAVVLVEFDSVLEHLDEGMHRTAAELPAGVALELLDGASRG